MNEHIELSPKEIRMIQYALRIIKTKPEILEEDDYDIIKTILEKLN